MDLATVDNVGNVRIYTLLATLSKMHLAPSNISQNEIGKGDLDAVVALHWLPISPGESRVSRQFSSLGHVLMDEVPVHISGD